MSGWPVRPARGLFGPAAALALAAAAAAPAARADFVLSTSLGTGLSFGSGTERTSVSVEVIPSYDLGPVLIDLGVLYNFEGKRALTLRPGLRVDLEVLYLRAAIPLQATSGTDYGLYLAIGKSFQLDMLGVFLEVGKGITRELGATNAPLELRLGVSFHF